VIIWNRGIYDPWHGVAPILAGVMLTVVVSPVVTNPTLHHVDAGCVHYTAVDGGYQHDVAVDGGYVLSMSVDGSTSE
jgi:hypothetical protein